MNSWTIQIVELNVSDLELMKQFYTQNIGLKVLHETSDKVILGVDTPLLSLYKIDSKTRSNTADLYHFALLVPTQQVLGEILLALYQKGLLSGASDHGYSEALYLNDPEGNGIEIYCDKNIDQWDIKDDGRIVGVTEEIDAQHLLSLAKEPFTSQPEGTKMGHVHLMVHDLKETQAFYEDLGFDLKLDYGGRAKFFARGLYHHHLGANTWHGQLPVRSENQLGVRSVHLHIKEAQPQTLTDPSGIILKINLG